MFLTHLAKKGGKVSLDTCFACNLAHLKVKVIPFPVSNKSCNIPELNSIELGHCHGKLLSPLPVLRALLSWQVSITRWRVWWWIIPMLPYSCGIQLDKKGKQFLWGCPTARLSAGNRRKECMHFFSLGKLLAWEGPERLQQIFQCWTCSKGLFQRFLEAVASGAWGDCSKDWWRSSFPYVWPACCGFGQSIVNHSMVWGSQPL